MIDKHFKKLVLLVVFLALGYWAFISRYQHLGQTSYFDRWTRTIVEIPTQAEKESQKQDARLAEQEARLAKQRDEEQWGKAPESVRKGWYRIYDSLFNVKQNLIKVLDDSLDRRYPLIGRSAHTRPTLEQTLIIKNASRHLATDSIYAWWRTQVDTVWLDFKQQHPQIPHLAPIPGFSNP